MEPASLDYIEKKPVNGDKANKLVLFLHGLGADAHDLMPLADYFVHILPGAHFVSPNAPFPCDMAPFGYQWFSLQDRSPEFIMEGINRAAPILNQFINHMLVKLDLLPENLIVCGFSQGAMMSMQVLPLRTEKIGGIVAMSGMLVDETPLTSSKICPTKVLMTHGLQDELIDAQMMEISAHKLKNLGFAVETHMIPNMGHGINETCIEYIRIFLKSLN